MRHPFPTPLFCANGGTDDVSNCWKSLLAILLCTLYYMQPLLSIVFSVPPVVVSMIFFSMQSLIFVVERSRCNKLERSAWEAIQTNCCFWSIPGLINMMYQFVVSCLDVVYWFSLTSFRFCLQEYIPLMKCPEGRCISYVVVVYSMWIELLII